MLFSVSVTCSCACVYAYVGGVCGWGCCDSSSHYVGVVGVIGDVVVVVVLCCVVFVCLVACLLARWLYLRGGATVVGTVVIVVVFVGLASIFVLLVMLRSLLVGVMYVRVSVYLLLSLVLDVVAPLLCFLLRAVDCLGVSICCISLVCVRVRLWCVCSLFGSLALCVFACVRCGYVLLWCGVLISLCCVNSWLRVIVCVRVCVPCCVFVCSLG